jgi:hypothetical protein
MEIGIAFSRGKTATEAQRSEALDVFEKISRINGGLRGGMIALFINGNLIAAATLDGVTFVDGAVLFSTQEPPAKKEGP